MTWIRILKTPRIVFPFDSTPAYVHEACVGIILRAIRMEKYPIDTYWVVLEPHLMEQIQLKSPEAFLFLIKERASLISTFTRIGSGLKTGVDGTHEITIPISCAEVLKIH